MPAERALLEAALDRLSLDLRRLADGRSLIDVLEAYLDLARPIIDDCDPRDRIWANARVEDIWASCPLVTRRADHVPWRDVAPRGRMASSAARSADAAPIRTTRVVRLPGIGVAARKAGSGLDRR